MQINPWIKDKAVFTGELADDKESLRRQAYMLYTRYNQTGGVIHDCKPAFAMGCEIRSAVRQAIRAGR